MNKKIVGGALLGVAGFMLLGFFQSSASLFSAKGFIALALTVGLPGFFGVQYLRGSLGGSAKDRMKQLRQQTIDAEILRLATQHQGRLTTVDVVSALALSEAEANASLEALVLSEAAEMEMTDDGVLVYHFRNARLNAGKHEAKDLLNG